MSNHCKSHLISCYLMSCHLITFQFVQLRQYTKVGFRHTPQAWWMLVRTYPNWFHILFEIFQILALACLHFWDVSIGSIATGKPSQAQLKYDFNPGLQWTMHSWLQSHATWMMFIRVRTYVLISPAPIATLACTPSPKWLHHSPWFHEESKACCTPFKLRKALHNRVLSVTSLEPPFTEIRLF